MSVKVYFAISYFVVVLATDVQPAYSAFLFMHDDQNREERIAEISDHPVERLAPYDGQFYLEIAARGYGSSEAQVDQPTSDTAAFFPLLPAITHAAWCLTGRPITTVVVLNILASAAAVTGVWRLAKGLGVAASIAAAATLLFPMAVFQHLLYTEALFLLLSVGYVVAAGERKWFSCLILGLLGGMCRPQGVLLVLSGIGYGARCWSTERGAARSEKPWIVLAVIAPVLGFVVVSCIMVVYTGSPLSFLHAQGSWGRTQDAGGLLRSLEQIATFRGGPIDWMGAVFGIGLVPLMWRRLPVPLALYGSGLVLMPLLTGSLLSMGRFMSVSFPHFLCLAALLDGRRWLAPAVLGLLACLQMVVWKAIGGWWFVG